MLQSFLRLKGQYLIKFFSVWCLYVSFSQRLRAVCSPVSSKLGRWKHPHALFWWLPWLWPNTTSLQVPKMNTSPSPWGCFPLHSWDSRGTSQKGICCLFAGWMFGEPQGYLHAGIPACGTYLSVIPHALLASPIFTFSVATTYLFYPHIMHQEGSPLCSIGQ